MWDYKEAGRLMIYKSVYTATCIYCGAELIRHPAQKFEARHRRLLVQLSTCGCCGWWSIYRVHQGDHPKTPQFECHAGAIGCLKELDLTDVSTPLNEVRQYLLAKKDSIFETHPKLFEDVVCSVFKDSGWDARVTAYSGDDGIDVVLDGKSDSTVGVQVKRYKKEHRIEAEQIRSLAGALLVNGHTKGIFVTTSSFRSGARRTAEKLATIGYPIELMDAKGFLEALGIAQLKSAHIDEERFISYLRSSGIHLGSGWTKDLEEGENLLDRSILASSILGQDFIDLLEIENSDHHALFFSQ